MNKAAAAMSFSQRFTEYGDVKDKHVNIKYISFMNFAKLSKNLRGIEKERSVLFCQSFALLIRKHSDDDRNSCYCYCTN